MAPFPIESVFMQDKKMTLEDGTVMTAFDPPTSECNSTVSIFFIILLFFIYYIKLRIFD